MKNFEYLEGLPAIPESLYPDIYRSIETQKNMNILKDAPTSEHQLIKGPLRDFLEPYFPKGWYLTIFQCIGGNPRVHVDRGRKVAAIYLIETGGTCVATNFYTDPPECKLVESHIAEPRKWFQLNALIWHGVKNIEPGKTRISISAYEMIDLGRGFTPVVSIDSAGNEWLEWK